MLTCECLTVKFHMPYMYLQAFSWLVIYMSLLPFVLLVIFLDLYFFAFFQLLSSLEISLSCYGSSLHKGLCLQSCIWHSNYVPSWSLSSLELDKTLIASSHQKYAYNNYIITIFKKNNTFTYWWTFSYSVTLKFVS